MPILDLGNGTLVAQFGNRSKNLMVNMLLLTGIRYIGEKKMISYKDHDKTEVTIKQDFHLISFGFYRAQK